MQGWLCEVGAALAQVEGSSLGMSEAIDRLMAAPHHQQGIDKQPTVQRANNGKYNKPSHSGSC